MHVPGLVLKEAEQIRGREQRGGEWGHMRLQGCNHTDDGICSGERQQLVTTLFALIRMLHVKTHLQTCMLSQAAG